MFVATRNVCSSIAPDNDNKIKKGQCIPDGLVKEHDNGVFVCGVGIYVDDLVWVSSTKHYEDHDIFKNGKNLK